MANPTLLTMPLCVNADKNTIPPTDAGTSGLFSEELGFQDINSLPLASGGKAPNRRDFNGIFALLGGIAYACQRGQTFEWVNNLPYLANCVVTDPLDGNKYNAKNDVAEGGSNPSLDPTNWEKFGVDTTVLANTDLSNLTATGEAKFTGRANTDLSNLTNAGKQLIINKNMPDYANGIVWTYSTPGVEQTYTAPSDGWVSYYLWGQQDSVRASLKVNGNQVIDNGGSWGSTRGDLYSGQIPVKTNDEIKAVSCIAINNLIFFPTVS